MTRSMHFGKRNLVAMGVGVAALTFATLAMKHCGQDRPATVCPPVVAVPSAPVKGDNRCEIEKGEHDPNSPTWDPVNCGFCGDGHRQTWETIDNCPVDFHCGNHSVDHAQVYGAYIAPSAQGGVYTLGTVTITETCRSPSDSSFCEADCPAARTPRPHASVDRPAASAVPVAAGPCPPEVMGVFSSRISSTLRGDQAPAARTNAGAPSGSGVRATVSLRVSGGTATVTGVTISCSGCAGGSLSPGVINLGGLSVDSATSCSGSVGVNIPPG